MTIKFNELDAKNVEVMANDDNYGELKFDEDQNSWVLWPNTIDDAVTYFESLDETKEAIIDEINDFVEED